MLFDAPTAYYEGAGRGGALAEDWVRHFRELELEPGATRETVKQSWRDLMKIWHPDRFEAEPRLRQRCQEKVKRLNEAYEAVERYFVVYGAAPVASDSFGEEPRIDPDYNRCATCRRTVAAGESQCAACTVEQAMARPAVRWKPRTILPGVAFLAMAWATLALIWRVADLYRPAVLMGAIIVFAAGAAWNLRRTLV